MASLLHLGVASRVRKCTGNRVQAPRAEPKEQNTKKKQTFCVEWRVGTLARELAAHDNAAANTEKLEQPSRGILVLLSSAGRL